MIESYRSYLATKPLDILNLYLQLRATPLGPEFPKETFVRTPIKLIGHFLHVVSTAKLCQVVLSCAQAMGGSKERNRTKIEDFLPFELDAAASETEELTKEILTKLVKSKRIPTNVIAALSPHITPG